MKKNKLLSIISILIPSVSFAFPADLRGFISLIMGVLDIVIPILSSLAFLVFFWGVAKFILKAGDTKESQNGRDFMMYGLIALFILLSFLGILQFLSDQFEFGKIKKPFLPGSGSSESVNSIIKYDINPDFDLQRDVR